MVDEKYSKFCELFFTAEEKIKQVELISKDAVIPAINQLRYAACHLARFFSGKEDLGVYEAERHCKRAIYDAVEVGIYHYLEEIAGFQKDYKLVNITKIIPDYISSRRTVGKIQSEMSFQNRHEVENAWEPAQGYFETLQDIYEVFEAARPELSKLFFFWKVATAITMIGIFTGIVKLYLC